jgi:hypothetical protein
MDPAHLMQLEFEGFFAALVLTLVYRMLTRRIWMKGLFANKLTGQQVSPERVQLFVATLAISGRYLGEVLHNTSGVMPDMNASMVSVFGASGSVYAGVKAFKMFTTKAKRKR